MDKYYVYTLIDPRDDSVFYVGKGKGDRINYHFKELDKYLDAISKNKLTRKVRLSNVNKTRKMKVIREEGLTTNVEKLIENLSEDAAFALEELLVERIGRKILKSGSLLNIEPGGNWEYPKIVLTDAEKTTPLTVENNFPEIIPILEKFPHIAIESKLEKRLKENKEND